MYGEASKGETNGGIGGAALSNDQKSGFYREILKAPRTLVSP